MARKDQLRTQRAGTIINVTSKKQESDIIKALNQVVDYLQTQFGAKPRTSADCDVDRRKYA